MHARYVARIRFRSLAVVDLGLVGAFEGQREKEDQNQVIFDGRNETGTFDSFV